MTGSRLAVAAEIERLHVFFERWFAGDADASLDEFTDALDPDFYLVHPSGAVMRHDEIVALIARSFSSRTVQIRVADVLVRQDRGVVVATYEEHQITEQSQSSRISTVVMTEADKAPGGWRWLAVHETWLPAAD